MIDEGPGQGFIKIGLQVEIPSLLTCVSIILRLLRSLTQLPVVYYPVLRQVQ